MLKGYGSDFAIAASLIGDFGTAKRMGRYTLLQAFEKVIERQECLFTDEWNYIWWYIANSGEPEIIIDYGKINYEDSVVWQELKESSNTAIVGGHTYYPEEVTEFMIRNGISYGQKVLSRCRASWYRTSYEYDEYDIDWECHIIRVEYTPVIDIPMVFDNPFQKYRGETKLTFVEASND